MRTLYYVPILLHTPDELGSLAEPLLELEKRIHGPRAEKNYREKANQSTRHYVEVIRRLKEKGLNTPEICQKLHIYVDGLSAQLYCCKACLEKTGKKYYMDEIEDNKIHCSACGRTVQADMKEPLLKVVRILIESKLPQYLIIEKLTDKGAKIEGTESLKLLLEEHEMWGNAAKGISPDPKRMAELLKERDEFISQRVDKTLPENGLGLLFIGAAHKVPDELKKFPDIKIIFL